MTTEELKVVISAQTSNLKNQIDNLKKTFNTVDDSVKKVERSINSLNNKKINQTFSGMSKSFQSEADKIKKSGKAFFDVGDIIQTSNVNSGLKNVSKQVQKELDIITTKSKKITHGDLRDILDKEQLSQYKGQKINFSVKDGNINSSFDKSAKPTAGGLESLKKTQDNIKRETEEVLKNTNALNKNTDAKNKNASASKKLFTAANALKAAFVALGVGVAFNFIKDMTTDAIGLEGQIKNLGRTLGSNKEAFLEWAKSGATAIGIGEAAAIRYGNSFSNMFSGFMPLENVASKTIEMLKASAIIATSTGRTIEDVNERIRSGLLGNTEAIEDLGINVGVNAIQATQAFQKMSNGLSWDKLNFQTQQQIRLMAILEQTYSKFGGEINGGLSLDLAVLSAQFNNLKLELGRAFIPIATVVIPALTNLVIWLKEATMRLGEFFAYLFDFKPEAAKTGADLSKSATASNKLATGMGSAAKAAKDMKDNMLGIDELNVLSKPNEADSGADTGTGAGGGALPINTGANKVLENKGNKFLDLTFGSEKFANSLKGLGDSFKMLGDSVLFFWNETGFGEMVTKGLLNVFTQVVDILSGSLQILAGAFDVVSGVILIFSGLLSGDTTKAIQGLNKLWEGFVKMFKGSLVVLFGKENADKIMKWFGDTGIAISNWWTKDVSPWFTTAKWTELWTNVKKAFSDGWNSISTWWNNSTLVKWWTDSVSPWFTSAKWSGLWTDVKTGWNNGWKSITDWWTNNALGKWWAEDVTVYFTSEKWSGIWTNVVTGFTTGWNNVITWWNQSALVLWWRDSVSPYFTAEKWTTLLAGMKTGISKGFTDAFNGAIDIVEKTLNWIIDKMNKISFKAPDWVPGIGGKNWGVNITPVKIPRLASGGIVSAGQAFVAGEAGKELIGSYNGKTTVMPLENTSFVSAIADAVYNAVLNANNNGDGKTAIQNILQVDGDVLYNAVNKVSNSKGYKMATVTSGLI